MTAQIVDGRTISEPIIQRCAAAIAKAGIVPELALVMVEQALPQVRMQTDHAFTLHIKILGALGINVRPHRLGTSTSHADVAALLQRLNRDSACDGIFVLAPLPAHIKMRELIGLIDPAKELEGLHPVHAAKLLPVSTATPERRMVVPHTLRTVFDEVGVNFTDAHVVIVLEREALRSNIITQMVARFSGGLVWPQDTVVTVVHSEHPQLATYCRLADVLLLAIQSRPGLIVGDMVKPGAGVFDFNAMVVGSKPHPTKPGSKVPEFRGGADNDSVAQVAKVLCPAPGGFGPVMLALLAENLVHAAIARRQPG